MRELLISKQCHDAIRRQSIYPFQDQSRPSSVPGHVIVPVEEEVYNALKSAQYDGEDMSDTILRLLARAN